MEDNTKKRGKTLGFYAGLDLGQSQDYTALSVIQQVQPEGVLDKRKCEYHIRHMERPALGTLYPAIVQRTKDVLSDPALGIGVELVVDKTGVGAAVVDLFRGTGLKPRAITITGGNEVNRKSDYEISVPKREVVGLLVALFQSGRLKIAADLVHASTLVNELLNFKVKISDSTGHDSYEAWRESIHDDLVLSVALACWYAENKPKPKTFTRMNIYGGR